MHQFRRSSDPQFSAGTARRICQECSEKYEDAAEAFEMALSIYPNYYDALFNLRDTYLELGNKTGAKECTECMKRLKTSGSIYD